MELKLTPEEIKDCETRMKAMGFKETPSSDTFKPLADQRMCLAIYAHEVWCGWMKYMFGRSYMHYDGSVTISSELADRWKRQMNMKYKSLTEKEKESDRKEADRILEIISTQQKG